MRRKNFYEFRQDEVGNTELFIYGYITSDNYCRSEVGSSVIADEIKNLTGDITVRINSYGGEVCEGLAIYNLLKDYGKSHKVTTVCDGFACSAASVVFMAGNERIMNEGSLLLIHNAWTLAEGDANAMRKAAEDLEKVTQPSIDIYKSVSNLAESEIKKLMDAETWILPTEALEMGFATAIDRRNEKQSINGHYLTKQIEKNKKLEAEYKKLLNSYITLAERNKDSWVEFFN